MSSDVPSYGHYAHGAFSSVSSPLAILYDYAKCYPANHDHENASDCHLFPHLPTHLPPVLCIHRPLRRPFHLPTLRPILFPLRIILPNLTQPISIIVNQMSFPCHKICIPMHIIRPFHERQYIVQESFHIFVFSPNRKLCDPDGAALGEGARGVDVGFEGCGVGRVAVPVVALALTERWLARTG